MSFEPEKLFIGVIDFFSILLPGALLAYLVKDQAADRLLGQLTFKLQGVENWMLFLFASYALGHLLFLAGSRLDEFVYDPIRKSTKEKPHACLSDRRKLSTKLFRWLAKQCFKEHPDAAIDRIEQIKNVHLKRIEAPHTSINAFRWCKARLALNHQGALAIVNRFEADSKFFRSFVPLLVGLIGVSVFDALKASSSGQWQWGLAVALTILLVLALWRYATRRFKAVQQACWFLLTLEADQAARPSITDRRSFGNQTNPESSTATHAGGVVVRQSYGKLEYLLVQASKKPTEWVLPKGHIEVDEDLERCALREVREETGVCARITNELKLIEYYVANQTVKVQFYLMEAADEGDPRDEQRKHLWLPLDKALQQANYKETKDLLTLAEQMRART